MKNYVNKYVLIAAVALGMIQSQATRLIIIFEDKDNVPVYYDRQAYYDRIEETPPGAIAPIDYDHVRLSFVDDGAEIFYIVSRPLVRELMPRVDVIFKPGAPIAGFLDLTDLTHQDAYYGLNAEVFGLIMRLSEEGRNVATRMFTQESLDRFIRRVVQEGLIAGAPVLGCTTPVALALTLSVILGNTLQSPVANQLMALATTIEYARMSTSADSELAGKFVRGLYGVYPVDTAFVRDIGILNLVLLKQLCGHNGFSPQYCWAPNSTLLACVEYGGKNIVIWNVATGACIAKLVGHTDSVKALAWSPDGTKLASGGYDNTIIIWSQAAPQKYEGHTDCVSVLAWSPTDNRLASCSHDGTIRIWDTVSGICLQQMRDSTGLVEALAWSPNEKLLATVNGGSVICVWDSAIGKPIQAIICRQRHIHYVAWTQDGRHLVNIASDHTVSEWDVRTGLSVRTKTSGAVHPLSKYALSPDEKIMVTADDEGATINVFGLGPELSGLDQRGMWHMLVQNAQRPFTGYHATRAAAREYFVTHGQSCPTGADGRALRVVRTEPVIIPTSREGAWQELRLTTTLAGPLDGRFTIFPTAAVMTEYLPLGCTPWQLIQGVSMYRRAERESDSIMPWVVQELHTMLTRGEPWYYVQNFLETYRDELSGFFDIVVRAQEYIDERRTGASSSGASSDSRDSK